MQEVLVDKAKRTAISISQPTKRILDSIKHPGQSYDGLLQELIKLWQKEYGGRIKIK